MTSKELRDKVLQAIDFRAFYGHYVDLPDDAQGQIDVVCPIHPDKRPSLSLNLKEGSYHCKASTCPANAGGGVFDFYALRHNCTIQQAIQQLAEEHGISDVKAIDSSVITSHRKILQKTPGILKFLKEKCGWTAETLNQFEIGFDGERITIPIRDKHGNCVNIRRYKPGASEGKMVSYKQGFGAARLFPYTNLESDSILLLEGEKDCILANQVGYDGSDTHAAMTTTGGAGTWRASWNPLFKDKRVAICYDCDGDGIAGAEKIAFQLSKVASEVRVVKLPLTEPKGADFTNYILDHGHSKEDLDELIDETPIYTTEQKGKPKDETIFDVSLSEASESEFFEKRIRMHVVVSGKDLAPYLVPKRVRIDCEEMGSTKKCNGCNYMACAGELPVEFAEDDPDILELVNCTKTYQRNVIRSKAGIPKGCGRWSMENETTINVEELLLIPELDITDQASQYVVRKAFYLGHGIHTNQSYRMTGITLPEPQSQYATHLISHADPAQSSIDAFQLTPELLNELKVFQLAEDQQFSDKLGEIYAEYESHFLPIWGRRDVFTALDLVYHSILTFRFQGQTIRKGRVEALVIGDTRTGKSESAEGLMAHYRLGDKTKGENVSFAGLVGGLQSTQKRWYITWGKLVQNDRRLYIIDETSGLSEDCIANLSGIRSDGIAELTKIQTERTYARTRLIWLSNPRSDRPLNSYAHGVEAIKELIGRPEDIARFDFAVTCASGEVGLDKINAKVELSDQPMRYDSERCRNLVLFAWSRKPDQVVFTEAAETAILFFATVLGEKYTAAIPLVEPSEQRIKLARMAVAAAARCFSVAPEDPEVIVVDRPHVEFVFEYLTEIFGKASMAYDLYSQSVKRESTIRDEERLAHEFDMLWPMTEAGQASKLKDLVDWFLDSHYISISDICDITGCERSEIKPFISELVRQRAIKKYYSYYRKTPAFITWLRRRQIALDQLSKNGA